MLAFSIDADGTLSSRRVFADLPGLHPGRPEQSFKGECVGQIDTASVDVTADGT